MQNIFLGVQWKLHQTVEEGYEYSLFEWSQCVPVWDSISTEMPAKIPSVDEDVTFRKLWI